jgi:hypothetical protein
MIPQYLSKSRRKGFQRLTYPYRKSWIRQIHASTTILVLLTNAISLQRSLADWIDPETPFEARLTQRYSIRLKPIPSQAPTSTKRPSPPESRPFPRKKAPTSHPTRSASPSQSSQPSAEPSGLPSALPTYVPRDFVLVFSDEFNTPNRTFDDGKDPRWTALDKNDYTNGALHYYSPDNAVTSADGHLVITSEAKDTEIIGFDDVKLERRHDTKHFRSAMLQSWNKFCFTGGIIEAEVILPGKWDVGGLWPAFWLLGNLARHTFVPSSEHIWPWSSIACTKVSNWAQKVSGCHSAAHYGMSWKNTCEHSWITLGRLQRVSSPYPNVFHRF